MVLLYVLGCIFMFIHSSNLVYLPWNYINIYTGCATVIFAGPVLQSDGEHTVRSISIWTVTLRL